MVMMHRRYVLRATTLPFVALALPVPTNVARAQQTSAKAEVRLSEATSAVTQYVEEMSREAKLWGRTQHTTKG